MIVFLTMAVALSAPTTKVKSPTATFLTGASLMNGVCNGSYDAACAALAAGFYDGDSVARLTLGGSQLMCPPPKVSPLDLGHAVTMWLQKNPDKQNWAAAPIVLRALIEAYPCPQ